MTISPPKILAVHPLGMPWPTIDPFLFCVHHDDAYPRGNDQLGPDASLAGRQLGQDFAGRDGWNMYHGAVVPGFPQHPHRGFETVTIVRRGYIDHSDSLGATARFGQGDVQWLTAGAGIVHAEMFPLLEADRDNPLELFQIWLNLPAKSKLVPPHFTMLWSEDLPRVQGDAEVVVIAGALFDKEPPPPPPHSWAAEHDSDLVIATIKLQPHASLPLPATINMASRRMLYFFVGKSVTVAGQAFAQHAAIEVDAQSPATITAGDEPVELLLLQGRPIGEPVAQHGPFVMNTRDEIVQAFADYRSTQFGGWPFAKDDPHHGPDAARFAQHADGRRDDRKR